MSYRPVKHHGIRLAAGSFLHNAVFEPLAADPAGAELVPGRFWNNTTENVNKFTTSDGSGGVVINVVTTQAAVNAVEGKVGTLTSLTTTVKTSAVAAINEVQSEVNTNTTSIGTLANLTTTNKTDLVTALNEVKGTVNSIGNAFNYVTTIAGGVDSGTAFDLATLVENDTGDYYKVITAGFFVVGAGTPFQLNVGDGIVWNTTGGVDIIDNTDSEVFGTADEVDVTGTKETGFTAKLATAFKNKVTTLETNTGKIIAGTGLDPDGDFVPQTTTNYINAATTVMGGVLLLDTAVKTESDRAKGVEGTLASLTTTAKTNLVVAVNEVDANVTAVVTELNTSFATFKSTTAETSFVITHNLNSEFITVDVWVKDVNGGFTRYYNDVVAIEETDLNTVTISSTSAIEVKVVVRAIRTLTLPA